MTEVGEEEPEPTPRERRVQNLRRRMMKGTEQSPDDELQQAQDVLSWALRKHGRDSTFSIKAMVDVADQLARQGRGAEELDLRTQIVAGLRTLDPESLNTASAEMRLAACLVMVERYGEADPLLRHVVDVRTAQLGQDEPETLKAVSARDLVASRLEGPDPRT